MALCHSLSSTINPTSLTTHKLASHAPLSCGFLISSAEGNLRWRTHGRTTGRGLILSCSSKKPTGGKKKRASRANMSDSDLCEALLNFVAAEGLPEGHVPSTTDLSRRGRKDLANIVRRRGYKIISELLRNQVNESTQLEENLAESTDLATYSPMNPQCSEPVDTPDGSSNASAEVVNVRGSPGDLSLADNVYYRNNGAFVETNEPTEPLVPIMCEIAAQSTHIRKDALEGFGTSVDAPVRNDATLDQNVRNEFDGEVSAKHFGDTDKHGELDNLRAMLQQKKMELLQLRQEIEKEKVALSNLQNKAAAEMDYIQNLISLKDAELSTADEWLIGLKEVLIQYQGYGETVEVAGSFNGWHHRIKMDHHSSSTFDSTERETICWKATLWLYPGIYEIKFVVDGHWKIDPHRESITRGYITNNIIRVGRCSRNHPLCF